MGFIYGNVVRRLHISSRSISRMSAKPEVDVNNYLASAKLSNRSRLILGNESADMDSIVSALVFAFVRTKSTNNVYVPVVNTVKQDLPLRTDVAFLFAKLGLETNALTFVDEVNFRTDGIEEVVLVDHNRLTGSQEALSDRVTQVIDHHVDENLYTTANRKVEGVGSCASLIVQALSSQAERSILLGNECLCHLLLATILVDTVNHDQKLQRSTETDKRACDIIRSSSGVVDSDALFRSLQKAKFDQSRLSSSDLLRKDYKQWNLNAINLGIATTGLPLESWLERDGDSVRSELYRYKGTQSLNMLMVMVAFFENLDEEEAPEFRRELIVVSDDAQLLTYVVDGLSEDKAGLELEHLEIQQFSEDVRCFSQKNVRVSRKILQPILAELLSNYST
uniref:DHHA2 domain-containing protein n=1 Tax=Rhodosorus marinus TaxID=101924 RepID=A0A7S0BUJ9_9RHOD|mmetsp:Transcript_8415/g.12405  ORF Transcript_8415/g.12405 Transcript_8415/m.12405 type:complete len:394 (+) Transcript_8415:69-1250(+)